MTDPGVFARIFLETFDKSGVDLFRGWLALQPGTTKWIIAADFALRDTSRPGDCFAFTIIPYDKTPDAFAAEVRSKLPKDLKDSRSLVPGAAAWLRDPRHFHVVIPMNRDRVFYGGGPDSRHIDAVREGLKITLQELINRDRDPNCIRRVRMALGKSRANAFNVGLFTDLTLLSLYLPLLTLILWRECKPEMVGWFCDRDSMSSWCDGVIWNFAMENLSGLAERLHIDISGFSPVIATPDRSSESEVMWYDQYIRGADWLAGTLATWDRANELDPVKQQKYIRIVEDVVADSQNAVFLPVIMDAAGFRISRLSVRLSPPSTSEVRPESEGQSSPL